MSLPRSRMHLRVTERDIAMFDSLATARFLTPQALEWLHFPRWRERYATHQVQQQEAPTDTERYKPANRLYSRLKQLRDAGLVMQIVRPVSFAIDQFRRDADAYALTEHGARVLATTYGRDIAEVWWEARQVRSAHTLPHSVAIGVFYAAMRAKVEATPGLVLDQWCGDHLLARAYDRITVASNRANGSVVTESLPIQPDATFVIRSERGVVRCFVEIDRGRSIQSWKQKIAAYHAYTGSKELRARYDAGGFVLLAVTVHGAYRQRLMETTAEVLGQPSDRYLFCGAQDVHPLTIGAAWRRIVGIEQQVGRPLIGGGMATAYRVSEAPHVFIA